MPGMRMLLMPFVDTLQWLLHLRGTCPPPQVECKLVGRPFASGLAGCTGCAGWAARALGHCLYAFLGAVMVMSAQDCQIWAEVSQSHRNPKKYSVNSPGGESFGTFRWS